MKFGLLYEISLPDGGGMSEETAYWNVLEQIALADKVGFDHVWCVEHHFLGPFSLCSSPSTFLAAVAQHTTNIRIGHGVRLVPPPYNTPPRVAEDAAVLDIMSRGRLEFGFGRSITMQEMGGFRINPADTRPMMEESMREIIKMWTEKSYQGYEGKYFSMPARDVVPKPVQKPHPPLWASASNPDSVALAAHMGAGVLTFGVTTPAKIAPIVPTYKNAIANPSRPLSPLINNNYAATSLMFCDEDHQRAMNIGGAALLWFIDYSGALYSSHNQYEGGVLPGYEKYASRVNSPDWQKWQEDARARNDDVCGFIGTPDHIASTVQAYADLGVDQVIFLVQVGQIQQADTMRSLKTFGEQVIPRFKKAADDVTGRPARTLIA